MSNPSNPSNPGNLGNKLARGLVLLLVTVVLGWGLSACVFRTKPHHNQSSHASKHKKHKKHDKSPKKHKHERDHKR